MIFPLPEGSRPLLADGAMATNFFDRGLRLGNPSELWNALHPERVQALHRAFVEAGADLLLTNSFGGHPARLRRHGLAGRTAELNRLAGVHARIAAAGAGRPIHIAGSVGPTGERDVSSEAARGFSEQVRALQAGGVDLLWLETLSFADETRVAAEAASATGLPYVLTASFDGRGRTLGGLDAATFARLALSFPTQPIAIGANCGADTEGLLRDLGMMRSAAPHLPLVAKANAGLPSLRDGRLQYPLSPDDMLDYARRAVAAGAGIVGGCCGTTPAHLAVMRTAIGAVPANPPVLVSARRTS